MTKLYDDPAKFSEDLLAGFLDLYADRVLGVEGGVVRSHRDPRPGRGRRRRRIGPLPRVLRRGGPGFRRRRRGRATSSPSPSTQEIVRRAGRAQAAACFFSYGNYAGDVMNFGAAAATAARRRHRRARPSRSPTTSRRHRRRRHKRRGIAGDFIVFKVPAPLPRRARPRRGRASRPLANARTRSFGIAFSGCTFPGAEAATVQVPDGQMGSGSGSMASRESTTSPAPPAPRARARARRRAPGRASGRVRRAGSASILNGLGTTKYEELFVLWSSRLSCCARPA